MGAGHACGMSRSGAPQARRTSSVAAGGAASPVGGTIGSYSHRRVAFFTSVRTASRALARSTGSPRLAPVRAPLKLRPPKGAVSILGQALGAVSTLQITLLRGYLVLPTGKTQKYPLERAIAILRTGSTPFQEIANGSEQAVRPAKTMYDEAACLSAQEEGPWPKVPT